MTERIHYSDAIVTPPTHLNPVLLANALSDRSTAALARFKTNVLIRYLPNVSTETAGTVAFAVAKVPHTALSTIAALQPSHTGPVWKPATLNIPKSLLNLQSWATADSECLYLVAANAQGSFAITTTLALASTTSKAHALTADPMIQLGRLSTVAFVGPRLEGFSLVCAAPDSPLTWTGEGISMNVDLTRATGNSTFAKSKGLRTPDNKPYIAVRFGMGSAYQYNYTTQNRDYDWRSSLQLYSYDSRNAPTGGITQTFVASWRPIHGSTNWWCDVRPHDYVQVINGVNYVMYRPLCLLVLYYYYPGIDIFRYDFSPKLLAHPEELLPVPPGQATPMKEQSIPLLMGTLQLLWSPYWLPIQERQQVEQLTNAKTALLDWPVTR